MTLLEVMAAVAILGIVTVGLTRAAIQGLQIEGDAYRRLRASLLADRALNEIETGLLTGAPPSVGTSESEEGPFRIAVDVGPVDAAGLGLTALLGGPEQRPGASQAAGAELLGVGGRGLAPPLLAISVQVTWIDGVVERDVTRTTFAFDDNAAAPLLEALSPAPDPAAEQEPQT